MERPCSCSPTPQVVQDIEVLKKVKRGQYSNTVAAPKFRKTGKLFNRKPAGRR